MLVFPMTNFFMTPLNWLMMPNNTPLYAHHLESGGKMVDFAGVQLPLHYGSQLAEHQSVRQSVGMFDVSHMTITDVEGDGAQDFLRHVLANDVRRLNPQQALYSCLLNDAGGILDDLIVYWRGGHRYRVVSNAATRDKVRRWFVEHCPTSVKLTPRDDWAMIAVQGSLAIAHINRVLSIPLKIKRFFATEVQDYFIARTGYTGEDGVEVMAPASQIVGMWEQLREQGVPPCGLGARDSLRLEAGMMLYGQDINETHTPLDSGLGWTVAWDDHDFIGRSTLMQQRDSGITHTMRGLVAQKRGGLMRTGQPVYQHDEQIGEVTSGGFSPLLGTSIALARVKRDCGDTAEVHMRNQRVGVEVGTMSCLS
jgi:aminomethyltransferase